MKAFVAIRDLPAYRRDAFIVGLKRAGHEVRYGPPQSFDADALFVCWNRYSENHGLCSRLERAGGRVLIAENGYVGMHGQSPHSMPRRDPYALAPSYHNDSTVIADDGPVRWAALGVDLQPWRKSGDHILVCPARSFGTPGRFMPLDWVREVTAALRKLTTREIRVRPHPGNEPSKRPLAADLEGCHAAVIWATSAGVHALIAGVPVICCAPFWIAKGAAGTLDQIEAPPTSDRLPHLQRLAWAQWSIDEIAGGEPFVRLLEQVAA